MTKPKLGLSRGAAEAALSGQGQALLPPRRDLRPDRQRRGADRAANIDGTRTRVECAEAIGAGCFHHTSSIAVAGLYPGMFREDMFDEAEGSTIPTSAPSTSPRVVRNEHCSMPWRIYRPAWWSATRRPARSTRSTAPTTSSP
jgi:hypothetical protein